jgi:hypothetical protein
MVAAMIMSPLASKASCRAARMSAGTPGVIGRRRQPGAGQHGGDAVGARTRGAINDCAAAFGAGAFAPGRDQAEQLAHPVRRARDRRKRQGRTAKRADEDARHPREEIFKNVGAGRRRRRRGRRDDLRPVQDFGGGGEPAVVGTEIMAPLRDAMRLVDRQRPHPGAPQQSQRFGIGEALGREIEQPQAAVVQLHAKLAPGARIKAGMQRGGRNPAACEPSRLIAHQGDERRDDQRQARPRQSGKLIDQRFSGPHRLQHEDVLAIERGLDRLALAGEKIVEAEALPQDGPSRGHVSHGSPPCDEMWRQSLAPSRPQGDCHDVIRGLD